MWCMNSDYAYPIYLDATFRIEADYGISIGNLAEGVGLKSSWSLRDLVERGIVKIQKHCAATWCIILSEIQNNDKFYRTCEMICMRGIWQSSFLNGLAIAREAPQFCSRKYSIIYTKSPHLIKNQLQWFRNS